MAKNPRHTKAYFEEQDALRKKENARHKETVLRNKSATQLEPEVRKFCTLVAEGKSPGDAAEIVGFEEPGKVAAQLMQRPAVQKALAHMIRRTMEVSETTREDVIAGFKDAIAIARQQSDAGPMIAGWREIGKMLGMYETKVKVEITGGGGEIERQLKGKSDEELLALIQQNSLVMDDAIDADFEEVDDDE